MVSSRDELKECFWSSRDVLEHRDRGEKLSKTLAGNHFRCEAVDTEGEKTRETNPKFEENIVSEALYHPLESLTTYGERRLAPIQGCTPLGGG